MPLSELYKVKHGTNKKFILVEEDRLAELTKFESILREEREKLGEQCTWVIGDLQTSARIPVPAIRLAMHNLCEAEMKKAAQDVGKLLQGWKEFSRKNGYNKSILFYHESYVNSAPVAQRAAKLKQLKKSNEEWLLAKNRATMTFEDDLSSLNEKYLNAQIRRRDYDRYFVLATRYGVFSEEEFFLDSRPGDRYYNMVVDAAVKLQRLWGVYWPIKHMRMHRAARLWQTQWRGHRAYKTWHPIIRIRIKVGKRALFKHMWQRWSEYNHLCREIRAAIIWYRENWMDKCFYVWRDYIRALKNKNSDLLNRFIRRMKNMHIASLFMRWHSFAQRAKKTKLYCRRIFQNPHFLIWVEYTKGRKHLKYLGKFAAKIQAGVRRYVGVVRYRRAHRAIITIQGFGRIVISKGEAHERREKLVKEEFDKWVPDEMSLREKRANEKEKRRLVWEQQLMQEKEEAMVTDLKRHLRGKNGRYQLNLEAERIQREGILDENGNRVSKVNKKRALKLATSYFVDRCSAISRSLGKHDFNTKNPAPYRCADNSCRAIFASPEQYHKHMLTSERHEGREPQYAQIHISLKTSKFQETLREYLTNHEGIDKLVNCLDLWISIQEWRKTPVSTELYVAKAMAVYDTFLATDCTRPVDMDFSGMEAILEKLKMVKYREFEGMYKIEHGKVSWWRWLLRMEGRQYEAWTTDNVVFADCLDEIEWRAFLHIFQQLERTGFMSSPTGQQYLKEEEEAKTENISILLGLYRDFRYHNIVAWTKQFMIYEAKISALALEISNMVLEVEETRLVDKAVVLGTDAATFAVMHEEQRVTEGGNLLADDSVFWAMEDMIEDVYEHFVHKTVEAMWEEPDSRKTLLEFAGYLRKSAQSRLLIKMNVKNKSHDWFNEFVNTAIEDEKKSLALDPDGASVVLQRRWRGVRGRNKARKIFVQVYRKM